MPKITDPRLIEAKQQRIVKIRERFNELYRQGLRHNVVIEKLIVEIGYSESTLSKIVKQQGKYI